jgi:hypothetical protein
MNLLYFIFFVILLFVILLAKFYLYIYTPYKITILYFDI